MGKKVWNVGQFLVLGWKFLSNYLSYGSLNNPGPWNKTI